MHSSYMMKIDYLAERSGLNEVNAGVKAVFGILLLGFCISINEVLPIAFAGISMMIVTMKSGRVEAGDYFRLLAVPFSFILLGSLAILVEISSADMGFLYIKAGSVFINITKVSLSKAAFVVLRAYCAITCLYFISLSTPLCELIHLMQRLKLPSIITDLMFFVYRYIMILLEIQYQMSVSARSRGGYLSRKNTFRTAAAIGRSLFLISLRKASSSFDAMEARGYQDKVHFLTEEKKVKKRHIFYIGVFFLVLGVLLLWEKKFL